MHFTDDDGRPILVRGYAAVFDVPSVPIEGGLQEILLPGCFDAALNRIRSRDLPMPAFRAHHLEAGRMPLHDIRLWSDEIGLAFEAGPLDVHPMSALILNQIVYDNMRGMSFFGHFGWEKGIHLGIQANLVRSVSKLDDIGPCNMPAYEAARCWLSFENIFRLPDDLPRMAASWEKGRDWKNERQTPAFKVQARKRRAVVGPKMAEMETHMSRHGYHRV